MSDVTNKNQFVLDETTLAVFKNFANINPQVVFKRGVSQRVCNPSRNFVVDVDLVHPMPMDCAIFELNKMLGVIDTCKDGGLPLLEFGDSSVVVRHAHGQVTIPYAHADVVAAPPTAKYQIQKPIASFTLPLALWTKIKRLSSTLDIDLLHFIIDADNNLKVKLVRDKDRGGDTMGSATFDMPNTTVEELNQPNAWAVRFDSLEFLPGDYHVEMGEIVTNGGNSIFGVFFNLIGHNITNLTYLTSGHVVKNR